MSHFMLMVLHLQRYQQLCWRHWLYTRNCCALMCPVRCRPKAVKCTSSLQTLHLNLIIPVGKLVLGQCCARVMGLSKASFLSMLVWTVALSWTKLKEKPLSSSWIFSRYGAASNYGRNFFVAPRSPCILTMMVWGIVWYRAKQTVSMVKQF